MTTTEQQSTAPRRELAAIMISDIAGYTVLMGHDEQKALRALEAHRALLRSLMPQFNGNLIGEIGDGTWTNKSAAREVRPSDLDM